MGIADDICVFGEAEEEHYERLKTFMEITKSSGLVFNLEKCTIKQSSYIFLSAISTVQRVSLWIRPKSKISTKCQYRKTRKEDLQRSLSLMTYKGSFLSNLSKLAAVLRDLSKKNVPNLCEH